MTVKVTVKPTDSIIRRHYSYTYIANIIETEKEYILTSKDYAVNINKNIVSEIKISIEE